MKKGFAIFQHTEDGLIPSMINLKTQYDTYQEAEEDLMKSEVKGVYTIITIYYTIEK